MGIAEHSIVSFRIFGDDLVPAEVTSLLGCEPTKAFAKGDVRVGSKTGNRYIERTGRWTPACPSTAKSRLDLPTSIPAAVMADLR